MRTKNAFTLVELIVVVSLMAIILGAFIALYTSHHQFYNMASIFTELRGSTKNFKNQISKDIEEAVEVVTGSKSLLGTSYTTSNMELVLKCYSTTSTGFDTDYYDYIAYRLDGSNIKRVVDADDTNSIRGDNNRTFIENVNNVIFYFFDNNEVEISSVDDLSVVTRVAMDMKVQKNWAGKLRQETIHSSVRLRNKR